MVRRTLRETIVLLPLSLRHLLSGPNAYDTKIGELAKVRIVYTPAIGATQR